MHDVAGFLSLLGDMPAVTDAGTVQRRSRDMSTTFSPIIRRDAAEKFAELIVKPRDRADVIAVARAAARTRMPLMMRGAGTCNLGQGVPLAGGAIVDMTALSRVLWTRDRRVRAEAGARLIAIDEATRLAGWELRMHPSTKRVSTIAGYIGGGHAGVGSCTYGILRDRGNIAALEMVSIEDEPRVIELRGDDVNLVHHAYGTNGIITEVEMPLAPAWPWVEIVANFPDFMTAARCAYALASSDGLVKKLISIDEPPNWEYMSAMRPFGRAGWSMVRSMVARQSLEGFRALVKTFGGEITVEANEGEGPYGAPVWEFAWGHARLQVNKVRPEIVNNIGLYLDPNLLDAVERSYRRFQGVGGLHLEAKRYNGQIAFQGSPYYAYVDDANVAAVIRGMTADGAMVADNHTLFVRANGMKAVLDGDAAFKRAMDPHGLMNPGKFDSDGTTIGTPADSALPTTGWTYGEPAPAVTRGQVIAGIAAATLAVPAFVRRASAQNLTKIVYQTGWLPQPDKGGLYQAAETGIYRAYGLDVELRPGGPQLNVNQIFLAGQADFVDSDSFRVMSFVKGGLPAIAVAAFGQKSFNVLLSHKGVGNDRLADLKGKTILVSTIGQQTYWLWLKAKYGFTDDQVRPHTFSLAPFLVDKAVSTEGFITSEPYESRKAGVDPVVHVLADDGYLNYSNVVVTSPRMVADNPQVVQRFVDATSKGWKSYLYGDPKPANEFIKRGNSDMNDDKIAYAIGAMKQAAIAQSDDVRKGGLGAMSDAQWKRIYDSMSAVGAEVAGLDIRKGYTLQFVNKRTAPV